MIEQSKKVQNAKSKIVGDSASSAGAGGQGDQVRTTPDEKKASVYSL
jgi:hypothetical protein